MTPMRADPGESDEVERVLDNEINTTKPSQKAPPSDIEAGLSEQDRREALKKLGKYIAYAAPALLAMTSGAKASCGSQCGIVL